MEGICPICKVRLELPGSGMYRCERCGGRFEVALGSPNPPPPPAGYYSPAPMPYTVPPTAYYGAPPAFQEPELQADLDLQAACATHPSNPAVRVCERCGDFMCRLCTTPIEGRAYCPKCFDLLYRRGSLQFAQRQFSLHTTTLVLGIAGLLGSMMCGLGAPLSIGAVVAGVKAMREYRERPDLPGRGVTIAGLVCSGISFVFAAAWVAFFVWGIFRSS